MYGEKIVREGGFYVNQKRVQNPDQALIKGQHVLSNGITLFRVGKCATEKERKAAAKRNPLF